MLLLSTTEFEQIRQHGEEAYPNECCGVLLGGGNSERRWVSRVVRCVNTKGQAARTRYKIAPKQLIDIQREGRERGEEIVGFYHSHPDAPPHWSRTDLEQAYWLGHAYVIISIIRGNALEMKSYMLAGDDDSRRFEEEPVKVLACNEQDAESIR